jgi:hypothetical protein
VRVLYCSDSTNREITEGPQCQSRLHRTRECFNMLLFLRHYRHPTRGHCFARVFNKVLTLMFWLVFGDFTTPRYRSATTNTLVPYVLFLICKVPCVYRLSPTHSCHIYRFSCVRCFVTTVCHQHTRVVSCVSYVWCLVSAVHPQHTRVVLSVSGSNSSNQFQSVATDCDRYT